MHIAQHGGGGIIVVETAELSDTCAWGMAGTTTGETRVSVCDAHPAKIKHKESSTQNTLGDVSRRGQGGPRAGDQWGGGRPQNRERARIARRKGEV